MASTLKEIAEAFLAAPTPEAAAEVIKTNVANLKVLFAGGPPSEDELDLVLRVVEKGNALLGGTFLEQFSKFAGPWVARVQPVEPPKPQDPVVQPAGAGPTGSKPESGRRRKGKAPEARKGGEGSMKTKEELEELEAEYDRLSVLEKVVEGAQAEVEVQKASIAVMESSSKDDRQAAREKKTAAQEKARKVNAALEDLEEETGISAGSASGSRRPKGYFRRLAWDLF